ncbi:hypothetical protein [Spirosoma sp. KCTC 42546]|uniref:DUF6932 family protein n=1 Tax=Spirosoma sp. KCTC 42546 TaxID=2520506 RepID=UPI00352CEE64
MISFDHNGNLIPYALISLNPSDIFTYFVAPFPESTARPILHNHYLSYVNDLTHLLNQSIHQWLGGSFISAKINPNDIDCVNLIVFNESLEESIDSLIPYLLIGGSRDTYYVDGHLIAIYPPTDERYEAITLPSINYWQAFLMKDRQDNPRGIIELIDAD